MKRQSGFTLIEVVMSIVILGILAATAVPRFTDLSAEAKRALLHAAANALYSASLMNYAGCAMNGFVTEDNKCKSVVQCGDIVDLVDPPLLSEPSDPPSGRVAIMGGGEEMFGPDPPPGNGAVGGCEIAISGPDLDFEDILIARVVYVETIDANH